MRLVDNHFPRLHKYYKLFNRNIIRLSYSCKPNMNNIIWKHNSKFMENPTPSTTKTSYCHWKTDCPMDGSCLSQSLIYKASVSSTANKYYYGTNENTFKECYTTHKCSFRNESCEKNTELSKYIWKLKERDINYFMNWGIAMKLQKYIWGSWKCDLCIFEKLLITRADPNVLLNKHDKLISKCWHGNRFIWSASKIDKMIYTIWYM